eukprot:gnl/TRDRNA2_/TRDRNA2_43183_c0_seq1.p1 gnl/TRDRNA2_/TRDRNA2_43183_c0~~gnl/TRDRNA2_/TRDRNA2_43183_c0_seq1.p1  ORF type:complete len:450 (-),score=78.82 gnl/TRDRNA2_/TRDRNA2_43183_c0_seq1:129-1478(-)
MLRRSILLCWASAAASVAGGAFTCDDEISLLQKQVQLHKPAAGQGIDGETIVVDKEHFMQMENELLLQHSQLAVLHKEVAEMRKALQEFNNPVDHSQIPTVMDVNGSFHERSLADRVRFLELKQAGSTNSISDPHLWQKVQYNCTNSSAMGLSGAHEEHHVCFDFWEADARARGGRPCVVYDLGIRAEPSFGQILMENFGCVVRAYDPSPVAKKWWESEDAAKLRGMGDSRYKFWKFAAGGTDGPLELFQYNWQQVSIVQEEIDHTRQEEKHRTPVQLSFDVEAKTLPTMLKDNSDKFIDVLKIDIEGSEYMFLQDIFDRMGCPPARQITVEWHHFSIDERYGSSPEVNNLHKQLNSCGFLAFETKRHWRNFVTPEDDFYISPRRYTRASFIRPHITVELLEKAGDLKPGEKMPDFALNMGKNNMAERKAEEKRSPEAKEVYEKLIHTT